MYKEEKSAGLTFVRCSSCRCLVPAIDGKCRMCGAYLTASVDKAADVQCPACRYLVPATNSVCRMCGVSLTAPVDGADNA